MIFSFFLLFLFVSSFTIYFLFRHGKRVLPPGNFCFPLVGESLQLIWAYKTEDPEPFIDQRVARYGKIFRTHLFGESTIFSADAEVNKFMLQNEGKLFESSYPTSISNLLGKHSLLLMKDGLHKRMHSLTMSFASSCIIRDHFLLHIDRLIRINMESWSGRIYLQDEAKRVTFDLMVKQLMSFEPGEWNEKLRKEYHLLIEGFFSVPLPLFFTSYGRAIKARSKVAEALRVVVKQRKEENGEINEKKNDMLGALIESEEGFSVEELIDFLLALLVAGYETTPIAITLAVKFLTETPAALALLKEEYEKILSTKMSESEGLEWNDYKSNMPFTQCVINETLRVGNIVSGFFRRAMTDVHIKGYTIPKDWKVFASFRAVHLDQDNYNDARTFNPWRWQENPLSSFTSSSSNIFTPFGGGSRLCPGYELARVEISVFLYHLVTRFSWVVAEEDKLVFFPTTRTMKRYPIIVKSRKGGSI